MANRKVGQPELNAGFNQAREVPVAHDKPRINDQRKVRPHAAGTPAMGYRPSGGAQKSTQPPALGKKRMELRNVPLKHMTEADLASLPWAHTINFGGSRRQSPMQGPGAPEDAVAYQITPAGIKLFHIQNGQVVATNPRSAAIQVAHAYAREHGIRPSQVGEAGKDIPMPNGGGMGGGSPAAAPAPEATPAAAPEASPTGRFSVEPGPTLSMGHRAEFMRRAAGKPPSPSPAASPMRQPRPMPAAAPAAEPGSPAAETTAPFAGETNANAMMAPDKEIMYKNAPEYFPPGSLDRLSPYQLQSQWHAWISNKPTKGMMNNFHKHQAHQQMAAESVMYENRGHVGKTIRACKQMGMRCSYDHDSGEFRVNHPHNREETAYYTNDHEDAVGTARHMKAHSMSEGYPDPSFDRHEEPAHSSKIGSNLMAMHHAPDPGQPDLNREFAQFCDLRIEKVEEQAERRMTQFLDRFTQRLGFMPLAEEFEEEDEENDDEGAMEEPTMESRVPRHRYRWV